MAPPAELRGGSPALASRAPAGSAVLLAEGSSPAPRRPGLLLDDEARLRARLLEVLAYATGVLARLDRLAPLWPAEEGKGGGDDALLRRRDKVAAEGLLLAFLAARTSAGDDELAGAVAALVDQAERQLATARSEALLRRFPQTVTTLGLSFVLLSALGRPRPAVEELLRRQLWRGWATVSERSPYRLMDARWTFGQLDPGLLGPPEALLPFCTLAAAPHPLANLSDDDYALTHAVFYLTDFGRRPPPPALAARGAALLDPFLTWHAVQLDLDLLGEMLITALCLRLPRTPALAFAWETFAGAWEEDGLSGPEYSAERAAELQGEEREAYEVGEHYHTVFVGGILCAVALAATHAARAAGPVGPRGASTDLRVMLRDVLTEGPASRTAHDGAAVGAAGDGEAAGWWALGARCRAAAERLAGSAASAPPASAPAPGLEATVARLLQALAQPIDPPPPWLSVAAASEVERDGLARVLGDALLIATARRYRLVQLAEALAAAAPYRALRTPSFARALDFLLDQQLADGSVGIHRLLAGTEEEARASAAEVAAAQRALAGRLAEVAAALGG